MRTQPERHAIALSRFLAAIAATIGVAVLCGYALQLPTLIRLHPSLQGMSPLTAASIIVLAVAVVAATAAWERTVVVGLTIVIAIVGAALVGHFIENADVVSPAATRLVFGGGSVVGRMSLATALTLLLASIGVAARKHPQLSDFAAGFALLITAAALLGYFYRVDDLYALPIFNTMALHTAVALALLSVAVLLVEPTLGWSQVLWSSNFGGSSTRRQLGVLLVPALLGWILLEGTLDNRLGTASALALLVIFTVAPMAFLVLRDGRAQMTLDSERRGNSAAQARLASELERRLVVKSSELEREGIERSRVEEAMYRTQRVEAIGQLTGGIAHDFNNLLAAISGNLELMLRRLPEEHVARRYAVTAATSVGKGAKLAGQLLAFSRSQRLAIQPTEVASTMLHARELVRHALGPSIELLLEFPRERMWASTDPDQLELALLNLAVNAREAMPDGGIVRIESGMRRTRIASSDDERDYVSIRVVDTGVGMTPEVLAKAIEPFFTTHERGKGTGLGLAQVYGFARQCEGDLVIDSAPGQGTTVEMLLPLTVQPAAVVQKPVDPPYADRDGSATRRRLLVIDDDDAVRGVLVELLTEAGYEVTEASDGHRGLARLDEVRPDVAVIDFLMPGMNGAEVARHAQSRMPELPIVFVSGYSDTVALDGIAGAIVLRKPFQGEQLQRAVEQAIDAARPAMH